MSSFFVKYFEQLLSELYFTIDFLNNPLGIKSKIYLKIGISDFFPNFVAIEKSFCFYLSFVATNIILLDFSSFISKKCSDSYDSETKKTFYF